MVVLHFVALALAADPSTLPDEWQGTWSGTMIITSAANKRTEVPLVLRIEPVRGTNKLTWKTTYGEGKDALVKDYTLVPVAGQAGRFVIDEGNGIELAARLVADVLYSNFEVGGSVLTARYELRQKTLRMEITSARPAKEKTGDGRVQDYPVDVIQVAELKRK